jgi:hypothetical protein
MLTKCRFQDGPIGSVAVRLSGFHLDGDVHVRDGTLGCAAEAEADFDDVIRTLYCST